MSFTKHSKMCFLPINQNPLLLDNPNPPSSLTPSSTSQKLCQILQCFLKEKQQYQLHFTLERESMKSLYETTIRLKTDQIQRLSQIVSELQNMLQASRNETERMKVEIKEKDEEIAEMRRRLEDVGVLGRTQEKEGRKNQGAGGGQYLRRFADTERIQKSQKLEHREIRVESTRKMRDIMIKLNLTSKAPVNQNQTNRRQSFCKKKMEKCISSKNMSIRGKQNVKICQPTKKKSTSHEKLTVQQPRRSFPVSIDISTIKNKKQNEVPPFRECLRSSLQILKRLSLN